MYLLQVFNQYDERVYSLITDDKQELMEYTLEALNDGKRVYIEKHETRLETKEL